MKFKRRKLAEDTTAWCGLYNRSVFNSNKAWDDYTNPDLTTTNGTHVNCNRDSTIISILKKSSIILL